MDYCEALLASTFEPSSNQESSSPENSFNCSTYSSSERSIESGSSYQPTAQSTPSSGLSSTDWDASSWEHCPWSLSEGFGTHSEFDHEAAHRKQRVVRHVARLTLVQFGLLVEDNEEEDGSYYGPKTKVLPLV